MHTSLAGILLRFWLGLLGAVAGGLVIYRLEIFDPLSPAFKVLTLGSTLAGMLALWRSGARSHALLIAVGYSLFSLGFFDAFGWVAALSGATVGLGLVAVTAVGLGVDAEARALAQQRAPVSVARDAGHLPGAP